VSRKCAADQRLAAAALEPLIDAAVDSLGAAVFFSYLFYRR
jgi:hypothetical protein